MALKDNNLDLNALREDLADIYNKKPSDLSLDNIKVLTNTLKTLNSDDTLKNLNSKSSDDEKFLHQLLNNLIKKSLTDFFKNDLFPGPIEVNDEYLSCCVEIMPFLDHSVKTRVIKSKEVKELIESWDNNEHLSPTKYLFLDACHNVYTAQGLSWFKSYLWSKNFKRIETLMKKAIKNKPQTLDELLNYLHLVRNAKKNKKIHKKFFSIKTNLLNTLNDNITAETSNRDKFKNQLEALEDNKERGLSVFKLPDGKEFTAEVEIKKALNDKLTELMNTDEHLNPLLHTRNLSLCHVVPAKSENEAVKFITGKIEDIEKLEKASAELRYLKDNKPKSYRLYARFLRKMNSSLLKSQIRKTSKKLRNQTNPLKPKKGDYIDAASENIKKLNYEVLSLLANSVYNINTFEEIITTHCPPGNTQESRTYLQQNLLHFKNIAKQTRDEKIDTEKKTLNNEIMNSDDNNTIRTNLKNFLEGKEEDLPKLNDRIIGEVMGVVNSNAPEISTEYVALDQNIHDSTTSENGNRLFFAENAENAEENRQLDHGPGQEQDLGSEQGGNRSQVRI
jgi:hypothetical protein